ncbi:MAG: hypothetical protein DKT66_08400 [Candidatus Melainabacteria bacterium]|nr:MAG: hypothetical protein DKT66_08400 [Candidatus Melainabacteria bacterium]
MSSDDRIEKFTSSKEEIDLCFARFEEKFPTKADREEAILKSLMPIGFRCACGNLVTDREYGKRDVKCSACKRKSSITANTFYHGVRRLSAYCNGQFLMGEGIAISANDFAKRNGISSSQGNHILHTVSCEIVREMENAVEILTALLLEPVAKRSKETPAGEHPKKEQDELEKKSAKYGSQRAAKNPREFPAALPLREKDKSIFELLQERPLNIDELVALAKMALSELFSILTMLELDGFIRALPGNRYEVVQKIPTAQSMSVIGAPTEKLLKWFVRFVKLTFHAISRKYLQRYLARYWCFIDRKRWTFEALLKMCARAPYQSSSQLVSYVTPLQAKAVLEVA